MSTLIQPVALLSIILVGYLFKRAGKFKNRDYRILQVALFNLVLPCAIVYSFATNPHDSSMLWISVFGFAVSFIPLVLIFLFTCHKPVQDRAFTMLNGSGFNIGCFCFPVVQTFLGSAAIVPAAMFDIGNCVMVAAGTNVMTQTLLHIHPGKTLDEQYQGHAPVLPYAKPKDKDARRLARHALLRNVAKGFFGSVPFDTYLVMIVLMFANVKIPDVVATFVEPFANANSFISMLMVGMLMDLPAAGDDVKKLLKIIGLRLPFGLLFAVCAWFVLPFGANVREAVVMCCLAPIAVFSTLFTDEVLGNAKLAGFSLSVSAIIGLIMMTGVHFLIAAAV